VALYLDPDFLCITRISAEQILSHVYMCQMDIPIELININLRGLMVTSVTEGWDIEIAPKKLRL
jgi:hypothetical protein